MNPRRVIILGATGSIGTQALEVIAGQPGEFEIVGLAGGANADLLSAQARTVGAASIALADRAAARRARAALPHVTVLDGPEGVAELAAHPADLVLNGITGAAGLRSTLAALQAGTPVALANKESLIVGGALVTDAAARAAAGAAHPLGAHTAGGAPAPLGGLPHGWLLPVDSEHSALAQALRGTDPAEVARLLVTASGGPFRGRSRTELERVTAADALAHPTWDMGAVITVNSASLANKGLEVIEAHLLFGLDYDRIDVVVHPQSVVHGMVELCDGATIAKLSPPDMRLPIALALAHPERLPSAPERVDWRTPQALTFEPVDRATFPLLDLAEAAGRSGGTAPAVYNAANEVAVEAFLTGGTGFLGIARTVAAVLEAHDPLAAADLDTVTGVDEWARRQARTVLAGGR